MTALDLTRKKDCRHRPAEYPEPGELLQRYRGSRLRPREGMYTYYHYSFAGMISHGMATPFGNVLIDLFGMRNSTIYF
jgi:hypothetical protein